jgi:phage-related minor tail protein
MFFFSGVKVVGGTVAVPVIAGLAAGAVGLAAGVAVVALPVYGTYRLARRIRSRMRERKL